MPIPTENRFKQEPVSIGAMDKPMKEGKSVLDS